MMKTANFFPSLRKAQGGFTLVELMVGLLLTAFIASLALTYMVSSTRSFRAQNSDSVSQENARFALEILSQNIRLAGATNPRNGLPTALDVIYRGSPCPNNEGSITSSGGTRCTVDELANGSDRFGIDFVATGTFDGCNFTSITVSGTQEKRFANIFWSADRPDGGRSLYCQTYNITDSQPEGAAVPLIDGVERIQAQYGVDSDGDGVVERYVSISTLPAGDTVNVRSIRFCLLYTSPSPRDKRQSRMPSSA